MTPAQASGHPNFIVDVPVQGPTDEGMRAASVWFAQNRLPARPACVDCEGPIPMWARNKGLLGEQISFGGVGALGFALNAAGDPEMWTKLTSEQQAWVINTLVKLNDLIVRTTGTTCATWAPAVTPATKCFQTWFNTPAAFGGKLTKPGGGTLVLRTDGVVDQDTLDALRTVAALHGKDFPTPFPGTEAPGYAKSKLSTGAMVGIAAGGAVVIGGIVYAVTRGSKARRKRS